MLVTRRNKANSAIARTAALGTQLTQLALNDIYKRAGNYVNNYFANTGSAKAGNSVRPTVMGGGLRLLPAQKGKKRRSKKRGKGAAMGGIGRTLSLDRIRVLLKDVQPVASDLGGIVNNYFQLAINQTVGQDMRTWLPRANTLGGAFRYFKLRKIIISYQPVCAYTTPGVISIAVDPTTDAVAPGSVGNVIRHDPSCMGDVKDSHTIMWTPGDNSENTDKAVNAAGAFTGAGAQTISQGVFQIYGTGIGAFVTIGYLFFEADIEFYGLY